MRYACVRSATLVFVTAIASFLTGSPALAAITEATWAVDSPESAIRVLRLKFDGAVPPFEVRASAGGPEILFAGGGSEARLPDDVRWSGADGQVLQVRVPGSRLAGVRVVAEFLDVRVEDPAGAGTTGYRLGIGDVVSVAIYEDKSLSGEYTVGQDGAVNMPLVGAIPAIGATESELAARIVAVLGDYLDSPSISVTIRSFESQAAYVNIMGDAPRALKVALRPGMTLTDVVSEAGVALLPGQKIEVATRGPGGERRTTALTASELDEAGTPAPGDGDVVTVLEPEYVFIRGEVRRPGRWNHRPGLTLQQLIALSQGLTEWAGRKDIRIHRVGPDGEKGDIEVNLKRIEEGKDDDILLAPGDLVLVQRRVL